MTIWACVLSHSHVCFRFYYFLLVACLHKWELVGVVGERERSAIVFVDLLCSVVIWNTSADGKH